MERNEMEIYTENMYFAKSKSVFCETKIYTLRNENLYFHSREIGMQLHPRLPTKMNVIASVILQNLSHKYPTFTNCQETVMQSMDSHFPVYRFSFGNVQIFIYCNMLYFAHHNKYKSFEKNSILISKVQVFISFPCI